MQTARDYVMDIGLGQQISCRMPGVEEPTAEPLQALPRNYDVAPALTDKEERLCDMATD